MTFSPDDVHSKDADSFRKSPEVIPTSTSAMLKLTHLSAPHPIDFPRSSACDDAWLEDGGGGWFSRAWIGRRCSNIRVIL